MAGKNAIGIQFSQNTFVRDAGEYLVCAKLSRMGIHATLISRNAPKNDILATANSKEMRLQVKTSARKGNDTWVVKNKPKAKNNFYFIFVNWEDKEIPEFYVVPSKATALAWSQPNSPKDDKGWVSKSKIANYKNEWESVVKYFWGKSTTYYKHKF